MLQLAFVVLIMAVIAAILGFGGIVGTAMGAAEILFGLFIILFFLSVLLDRRSA